MAKKVRIGHTLAQQRSAVSVLLWGREGTGKTTSALRLTDVGPGRVALINAEAGAKKEALVRHGIDMERVDVWPPQEVGPGHITFDTVHDEVVEPLREALAADPESYVGVVVDSFSEVARRMLEKASSDSGAKAARLGKARDRWQITLEDHGVAAAMMRTLLRDLRDLPCHLVITALERRDIDSDTGLVMYGPALGPSVGVDTMGLVDLVGYCQVEEIGGETFRTAMFSPTRNRRAKDRYGVFPPKLVDPFADRIVGYVEGRIVPEDDEGRKRVLAAIAAAEAAEESRG